MTEMEERVARAICRVDGYDPDNIVEGGQASGFADYGPLWQAAQASEGQCGFPDYVAMARAAIAAMPKFEWQPIDTAPETDWGKPVAGIFYGKRIGVCAGTVGRIGGGSPCVHIPQLGGEGVSDWGVTKWQPLPAPPSE